jgi:hypothetical protein
LFSDHDEEIQDKIAFEMLDNAAFLNASNKEENDVGYLKTDKNHNV